MNYKKLKKLIKTKIESAPPSEAVKELNSFKFKQLAGPLKGLLFDPDPLIKFRASELLGLLAKDAAEENIEQVRDLMRQLMWNLNEESGGIGWGSVEAMAEIASNNKKILNEFFKIIISYSDPLSSSFLDHEALHPGAAWAVGKILKETQEIDHYTKYVTKVLLDHKNPQVKGCALWGVSHLSDISGIDQSIKDLEKSNESFDLYKNSRIETLSLTEMAEQILKLKDYRK
ncbi:MAG: hypothetical protein RBR53_02850 [Desulforegulaceae bacterium]|nr:hypothetical protein [Desulforegulaceae bacterium]